MRAAIEGVAFPHRRAIRRWAATATIAAFASPAHAAEAVVAVAANFAAPAEEIAAAFSTQTGHDVALSFGATGSLYTQITQGAPFALFLAADDSRPTMAIDEGLGVEDSAFTYAIGKLVLYSPTIDVTDGVAALTESAFEHMAIADPNSAPYGAAALDAIGNLGLTEALEPKLVTGENITQTLQFIESGNAEIGFVALSQVIDKAAAQVWRVPTELYSPIRQDAVLLKAGENDAVASAFLEFLSSDDARAIIEKYGYDAAN